VFIDGIYMGHLRHNSGYGSGHGWLKGNSGLFVERWLGIGSVKRWFWGVKTVHKGEN